MRRNGWIVFLVPGGLMLWFSAPRWLGFSPGNIPVALETGAAVSAKLICSSEHVSGLGIERGKTDLLGYSPAVRFAGVKSSGNTITASFAGNRYSAT